MKYTEMEAILTQQNIPPGHVKMKSVFMEEQSDEYGVGTRVGGQLQGQKFRQSEMVGFRRKGKSNSSNSKSNSP